VIRRHNEGILMEGKAQAVWRGNLQDGISALGLRAIARGSGAIKEQFAVIADKVEDSSPVPPSLNARNSLNVRLVP
jgi:hypothetical protein